MISKTTIKNTHKFNVAVEIYQGDIIEGNGDEKQDKIQLNKSTLKYTAYSTNINDTYTDIIKKNKKKIQLGKAGFHDIHLDTSYIITGSGALNCNLIINNLPPSIIKDITKSQGVYFFENKTGNVPAFSIKIIIDTNNCKNMKPLIFLISTATIIGGSYPNYSFQIQGTPALNTLNDNGYINIPSQSVSTTGGITALTTIYDIKKAIAKKYGKGYLSLDVEYDSRYFEFPDNGILIVENILATFNKYFPTQTHLIQDNLIISMKRQVQKAISKPTAEFSNNMSLIQGSLDDLRTTIMTDQKLQAKLQQNLYKTFNNRPLFIYNEKYNVINDIITLYGVKQIQVKVALTPSIMIGDRVQLITNKNDYNRMYCSTEKKNKYVGGIFKEFGGNIYYAQAVMHSADFGRHKSGIGYTQLYLCEMIDLFD